MRFSARALGAALMLSAVATAPAYATDDVGSFFHELTHIGDTKPERKLPPIDSKEQQRKDQLFTVVGGGVSAPDTGDGQVTVDESTNDVSFVTPANTPTAKPLVKPESKAAAPVSAAPQPKIAAAPKSEPETDVWDDVSSWFDSDTPKK